MRNPDHVVTQCRFAGGSLRAQADNGEGSADLTFLAGAVLVDRGVRRLFATSSLHVHMRSSRDNVPKKRSHGRRGLPARSQVVAAALRQS